MAVWDGETKKFLCECGCGEEALPWARFRVGHWAKTEGARSVLSGSGSREKAAESMRRRWKEDREYLTEVSLVPMRTEEAGRKRGETLRHKWENDSEFREMMLGIRHSPEFSTAISEGLTGHTDSEETKERKSQAMLGRKITWADKIREAQLEYWQNLTPERRQELGKISSEREKIYWVGLSLEEREELRKGNSESLKRYWNSLTPEEKDERIRENLEAGRMRPNQAEADLGEILERLFPGEFKYNDGWFKLERKTPDFVNVNSRKILIELYGPMHTIDNLEARKDLFRKYGWETLIIWDYDADNPAFVEREVKKLMEVRR